MRIITGGEGAIVFTKADVNGAEARPTYRYLREQGIIDNVSWNFKGKFIVDKEGNGKFAHHLHLITISMTFHSFKSHR